MALPFPADKLFDAGFGSVEKAFRPLLPPEGDLVLGGGTVLAAQWRHRQSSDLDLFVPISTPMTALQPRWGSSFAEEMKRAGASQIRFIQQAIKVAFPSGRIEISALTPKPEIPPQAVKINGQRVRVAHNAVILCGKLQGRGLRMPVRDIFDVAVAEQEDPWALRGAVNHMHMSDPSLLSNILLRLQSNRPAVVQRMNAEVVRPTAEWRHLLRDDGPDQTYEALEGAVYRSYELECDGGEARLSIETTSGATYSHSYVSASELADELIALGLTSTMTGGHPIAQAFQHFSKQREENSSGLEYPKPK